MNTPLVKHVEITVRGVILGILITFVFTAAQVFLGLKVGLTFATSIPAAVISMALLRFFKNATIQENNIVQTIASAAGTLSSVIFVLPGLIMIGWWIQVPFWETFVACAVGGVLGVMYTMPLRRALVTNSDLPYPEGVAAAEVLKIGTSSREGEAEGEAGLWAVIWGAVTSALFALFAAMGLLASEVSAYFRIGKTTAVSGMAGSGSLALIGAGHLMGITVGIAMGVGLLLAWGVGVPLLSAFHIDSFWPLHLSAIHAMPSGSIADYAEGVRAKQVRFIGAGLIGISAVWTLGKLVLPVWGGLMSALEADRTRKTGGVVPRSEQDLPVWVVGLVTALSAVPAGWLLAHFLMGTALAGIAMPLVISGVIYIILAGLLAAAVCGYMAGLIGSSNSPVSGIAILAVLGAAVIVGVIGRAVTGPDAHQALVAFALMVTTVVLAVAVIGNDNLQDLKTGQLVDATPWKQQLGLIIGVIAGAVVVPLILNLLNHVYGLPGDPHFHPIKPGAPLNAPQATLISTLAAGAIGGTLPMGYLGIGVIVGGVLILIDETLRKISKGKYSLPPLGVGLAVYLPSSVTSPVVIGAVAGWVFEKAVAKMKTAETAKRLGVLVASGFIVGESLLNVGLAIVYAVTQDPDFFSKLFTPPPQRVAMMAALVIAIIFVGGLYLWSAGRAKKIEDGVK
jgi:putative OPT family oligopeptide transporter